jgi:hypothetical protein
MKQLPAWVEKFNARKIPAGFLGRQWTKLRPEPDYVRSGIDDSPYERPLGGHRSDPSVDTSNYSSQRSCGPRVDGGAALTTSGG